MGRKLEKSDKRCCACDKKFKFRERICKTEYGTFTRYGFVSGSPGYVVYSHSGCIKFLSFEQEMREREMAKEEEHEQRSISLAEARAIREANKFGLDLGDRTVSHLIED